MLELRSVKKKYEKNYIITDATVKYDDGRIYGLAGYNGAGKTTLLKTMAGIDRPDGGEIIADGVSAVDNSVFRQNSFLMTEELFFDPQSTLDGMSRFYQGYYPSWDGDVFEKLLAISGLDRSMKIAGFSKGMQRQTGLILALSTVPHYLFLDETFDGLDIVKRSLLAKLLRSYADKRNALIVVTSHYLGELERMVDSVALIEDGVLTVPDSSGSLEEYFTEKAGVSDEEIEDVFA